MYMHLLRIYIYTTNWFCLLNWYSCTCTSNIILLNSWEVHAVTSTSPQVPSELHLLSARPTYVCNNKWLHLYLYIPYILRTLIAETLYMYSTIVCYCIPVTVLPSLCGQRRWATSPFSISGHSNCHSWSVFGGHVISPSSAIVIKQDYLIVKRYKLMFFRP